MDVNKIKLLYDGNTSIKIHISTSKKISLHFSFQVLGGKKAHFGRFNVILMRKVETRVYSYWSFNDNAGVLQKQKNGTVWYLVNSLFSVLNIHVKLKTWATLFSSSCFQWGENITKWHLYKGSLLDLA